MIEYFRMNIEYGPHSGIQGLRNLGIEEMLLILSLNPQMPKSLNSGLIQINTVQKKSYFHSKLPGLDLIE